MKGKRFIIFLILILAIGQISFALAQDAPGGLDPDSLQNDNVVKGVQQLQNFTDKERLDYLSEQWKEVLLKGKTISAIDSFLKEWNYAFLFLFGREYELSLALFFAVLMWVITLFILPKYFIFFKEKWMVYVGALGGTIILAQLQIFNSISGLFLRVYFYRYEWWWKTLSILVAIIALLVYFGFLRYFGKVIEANKKKKAEARAELDRKEIQIISKELREAGETSLH